jgi:tetratricopeptide (TPR) repeat protein
MATSSDIIFYRFSPENMDKNTLQKLFVGRGKLLESLFKELENAARKKTPRFYLIVGPRGIGKSHFLVLLYYEIQNKLGTLLIPIKLAEEEYSVFRASDLFLRILEEKSENTSDIVSLGEEDQILDAALEKLKQISKKDKKGYVIFVENLHELFKQLDTEELQKLRAIFQKHNFFSIVATAPMIFPAVTDHDEPFFNFFDVQHLREFSLPEVMELIQKIAEMEDNKKFLEEFKKYEPKIHGMSHLTGGSPRLVILFYEMITKGKLENVEKAFLKIIDEHTPYYQEIFQLLPMQRRRIFDILISAGAPITPKQISNKARIDLPTVTTQLRRLEKDGYIISRPVGRHTYYEVRERLFRLWREMRQPFGRKRVSVLLEFLQLWYTPDERRELFKTKFELLEAGEKKVLRELCYYAEILPPEFKAEALLKLTSKLLELGELDEAAYEIQKLKETAVQTKNEKLRSHTLLYEGQLLLSKNKDEEALLVFDKILQINPNNNIALLRKGTVLRNLHRYVEALEIFDYSMRINPKDEFTLVMKAVTLEDLDRHEEALVAFNSALEINPKYEFALVMKGVTLEDLDRHEEALVAFNSVLEINPIDEFTLVMKGVTLGNLDRDEEALEVFNKVLEINPKNEGALYRKGLAFGSLGRYEEALEVFNKALEINPKNEGALYRKGLAFGSLGRYEEALEVFNKALEINPKNEEVLVMKGIVLLQSKRYSEALEIAIGTRKLVKSESSEITATLILMESLKYLNRNSEVFLEIEKIKDRIANQEPYLIEGFIEICFDLALEELKTGNYGNGDMLMKMAFDANYKIGKDRIGALMLGFLKNAAKSGSISVIKVATDMIIKFRGDDYRKLISPIIKAIEIIETRDIQKYYGLQVEEREIVADIVKIITRSDELLPDEIKRKEGLKPL